MRPQGWESLLFHHIFSAKSEAFIWGKNDCVLWCADWVHKLTGSDPAQEFRTYSTEQEAKQLLSTLAESIPRLIDKHLPPAQVSCAQRGDIVFHPEGMLGICDGLRSYFLTTKGITNRLTRDCIHAWRV